MSEAQEAIEAERREKFRRLVERAEFWKNKAGTTQRELDQLRVAVRKFLDYPACPPEGWSLVDLVLFDGDTRLGEWWSDRDDTPTVADLARLVECNRRGE